MRKELSILALVFVFMLGLMVSGSFAAGEKTTGGTEQTGAMEQKAGWGTLQSVSDIEGAEISNQQGEKLGTIEDVMVDPQGRVAFVTLAHGGVLGMGGKKVAVPFQALSHDPQGKKFTLDVSKDRLANAPTFDRKEDLNQSRAEEIYRFYGVQPYWTGESGTMMERSPMRETEPGQSQPSERSPTEGPMDRPGGGALSPGPSTTPQPGTR